MFTVVITIESIIATLLMIINAILIIILIIKRYNTHSIYQLEMTIIKLIIFDYHRGKCQVRRPNSVRNKSEPKSKATDV